MRAQDFVTEAKTTIRDQIVQAVRNQGGSIDDYFVRFTDSDKLGYSAKQRFGQTPDMDDPEFSVDYIGHSKGRPVLWFYPLSFYLGNRDTYASEQPYAWLVKLKPTAWLQTVKRGDQGIAPAPPGKQRVGILRMSAPPAALFFQPGFDLVGKFYDYAGQHKSHGEVKGPPAPTLFQRIRGD